MIARAARSLPPQMPAPPSSNKANPSDFPVLFLVLRSATLPLSTINEYAESTMAQRISMVSGVAQVQVFGAASYAVRIDLDPNQLSAARHRCRRGGERGAERERFAADRHDVRLAADVYGAGQRSALPRPVVRSADHRLSQRQPGAVTGGRARLRRDRERQERGVVWRTAHDLPRHSKAAGHQRRRRRRRREGAAAGAARAAARGRVARHPERPLRRDSRVGARRQGHTDGDRGARRARDLPVPAESVGHHHPEPGAAGLYRRDLLGDAPARLQPR